LPGGVNLSVPEASLLHKVHQFLSGDTDTKSRAFVFESVTFDGSSVKTAPETDLYVRGMSALLKAFPTVEIRIDGHTDNVGDPVENQRIPQARANAVKDLLVKAGAPADRVHAEGHGSDKPVAPNTTEENRAKNRRIEVTFVKK